MKGEQSLAQTEMTPRSRQLYSFGDLHVSRLAPEKNFHLLGFVLGREKVLRTLKALSNCESES